MTRAVVFAYHNVGVRCVKALLGLGIEIPLIVTHDDDPAEAIWYASVGATAADYGIPFVTPADPNTAQFTGARPRYFGSSEPCMLRAPRGAARSSGAFSILR
jgi:methionyl-tRNA formyltransferase